jgi:hypothetical protein
MVLSGIPIVKRNDDLRNPACDYSQTEETIPTLVWGPR